MTTRDEILNFLRNPASFAQSATHTSLWIDGLDAFAIPSIATHHDRPSRQAQEAAWREDHRGISNGDQVHGVIGLAMGLGPSVDFCGYWQRAAAA